MASIKLEVITPSKLFYSGEVDLVIARTLMGDEGFMAGHAWACKLLDVDELWIQEAGRKEYKVAAVAGGYIDVKDSIILYTDAAEWQEDIDAKRAEESKEYAEHWLETEKKHDPNEIARAQIAIAKAIARMNVAGGGRRKRR
ncbi:MAG: ATP synthase F1 subunit epsilon [Eubacteriaceae bacterium]|nr:ATP synthase F1 subunit epsilon [Eubacteriaceae bacterium]